jgi:nucleotide-binding universal stress UspA family protein
LQVLMDAGQQGLANLIASEKLESRHPRAEVRIGSPAAEIVAAASDLHADLVCIGTHGRGGLARVILGSVAELVVRQAPCPVLTVRPKACGGA